jgi:glycosyltransferase involved in cell wall biosynthesis
MIGMKIGIIGTRGFPGVQGGIETHCLELYSRIAKNEDVNITVYRRTPYLNDLNKKAEFRNIRFVDIPVPKSKNFETLLHSFLATVHALFQGFDIVHYHNTGPGFFMPLLRITRARLFFTYHNVSYSQKKWSRFAKWFLNTSERVSMTNADYVIFISEIIRSEMLSKYRIGNHCVIANGVNIPVKSEKSDFIGSLGLQKERYILAIGRFLEEKGFDYLIRAFVKADLKDYKLVIAGDTDYPTEYSDNLKALAGENGVILTGFITGEKLNQVFTWAGLYVMSSFEEGLPIALLEAMSYDIKALASDIPANLQVELDSDDYFRVGDEDDLKNKILVKINSGKKNNFSEILKQRFNWDKIAFDTYNTYKL